MGQGRGQSIGDVLNQRGPQNHRQQLLSAANSQNGFVLTQHGLHQRPFKLGAPVFDGDALMNGAFPIKSGVQIKIPPRDNQTIQTVRIMRRLFGIMGQQ